MERKQDGNGLGDSSVQNHFSTYRESCTCLAEFMHRDHKASREIAPNAAQKTAELVVGYSVVFQI